ncbi:MAG: hypothetical protein HPY52_15055 [Firmicutes bacterium]|nr:hypothetical protein [Bacillota bacterium]
MEDIVQDEKLLQTQEEQPVEQGPTLTGSLFDEPARVGDQGRLTAAIDQLVRGINQIEVQVFETWENRIPKTIARVKQIGSPSVLIGIVAHLLRAARDFIVITSSLIPPSAAT